MNLDLKKPHVLICGNTSDGARYAQYGYRYKADGTVVSKPGTPVAVDINDIPPVTPADSEPDTVSAPPPEPVIEDIIPPESVGCVKGKYSDMSAADLKALVLARGGAYTNKDTAINYLQGQDRIDAAKAPLEVAE
jgi:hypothetical protein